MQPRTILKFVISGLIISLLGSIIFLLVTPPESFILFCIFLLLTATITLTVLGKTATCKLHLRGGSIELHFLLILACITLLTFQLEGIYIEAVNVILYVLALIFAPGFFLLNISKFKQSFSPIEFASLAYPISIASLAIFGTIALILPSNLRAILALSLVMFLSIISLYSARADKQTKLGQNSEFIVSNPVLILLMILLIFAFFYITLYPRLSSMLEVDISRRFISTLGSTQDALGNFYHPNTLYPLLSIYQSYMIYIVRPSVGLFQTASVLLNLLGILTFYTMARQYLKRYDGYLPALATLFWALFAGLGGLNFLSLRITNPSTTTISLIGQADAFSYGDITWRRLFFYLSMEISLVIVFAVLYFLKRTDLPRTKQVLFMTILLAPLPLMHPYAIYFLLLFLTCQTIFHPAVRKRAKYTACSLTIAAFVSLLLNYILNMQIAAISIDYIPFLGCLLTSLAIIAISSLQTIAPNIPKASVEKILNSKYTFLATDAVLLLYFASLLLWFSGNLTFKFGDLNLLGYVPWFLYPVKLGLVGILGIIALIVFLRNPKYRSREIGAMLASVLLLILASRVIATLQMQYVSTFTFDSNSWLSETIYRNILSFREERMFEIFKIPLAIVASIDFSKYVITKIKQKNMHAPSYLAVSGLISLILVSGMTSTFLGFEYYVNQTQTNPLSASELDMLNNMQNNIYADGKAIIIAPQTPISYLDFTGATAIATESVAAWKSKSPELPLFVTRYSKATPTYIYLHKVRDFQKLGEYFGNYLAHVSRVTPTYLENQEVQTKIINNWPIPTSQSSTALVIPYDQSKMTISQPFLQEAYGQYNALVLFFEEKMQFMNFYQEPIGYNNIEINDGVATFNGMNSYIRINGTETNFNRISVEFEFQPLDLTENQVILSKFDWGMPPQKSWEIAQYGRRICFKISPDGNNEEVLSTGEILALNTWYSIRGEYDGASMKIFINNKIVASKPYQKGIFRSNVDLLIGAELYNNKPTALAKMMLRYVRVLNDIPPLAEPIFYAYDILSSAGLNYTTIFADDNARNNYKTLVLPYDDVITYEILTEFEANKQIANTDCIVILNTNGYGPLLNLFGNISSNTFIANGIFSDKHFTIQPSIEVSKITLDNNTKVKAQYVNNNFSSPIIMTTAQSGQTLIYINIYPLLSQNQHLNPTITHVLTENLNSYMEPYNERTITPWFSEPSLLFTTFRANGTVSIRSNSIASIKLPENQTLDTNSYNAILINSTEVTVQRGYGFYTTLTAFNPSITLQGNQTTSIAINGNTTFLLRQPEISVDGTIQFENFYMLHPPTIYTDGRTTTLSGNITLQIYVSDEYTIALPYGLNSPIMVKYEKPLMEFNENTSFMLMLPYIILIMIFATTILLIQHSKLASTQEIRNENNKIIHLESA